MIEEENSAKTSYDELMAAKETEVAAASAAIEEKTARLGEVAVEIVENKNDLEGTSEQLDEDKKFLAEVEKECAVRTKEYEAMQKTNAMEMMALSDTIKLLNDDDALDLFKKTLPGAAASFLQMQVTTTDQQRQALAVIRAARNGHPELNFLALALQGKKVSFSKVIKMIDSMVATLKTEQQDDNDKKEYCDMQFDLADDKKKGLERDISNLEKAIGKETEAVAALADEIKALE